MIGGVSAGAKRGHAGGSRINGADENAGNTQRRGALVALQAYIAAREAGFRNLVNVQCKKTNALPRIERNDFGNFAFFNESNGNAVVEVERTRLLGGDPG